MATRPSVFIGVAISAMTAMPNLAHANGPSESPPEARLSRDFAYWRGRREESPGPFLCLAPAASDVTVVSDRWPDASDLRQFGLDVARLSGAETHHDKCVAVWRWVRRFTMCTNGTPPLEPFENPRQAPNNSGYISDPIKQLNVNGAHWCDGLSQVVAAVWRAMGYRAEKFYCHGHTLADCYYRDVDGIERWHLFDVSEGGFVLDRTDRRVLAVDELVYDFFTDWYFGWVHCQHLDMPTHRVELAFRPGERLERVWGNWGLPYQDNVGHQSKADREHGPYRFGYGNGRWIYTPDLSSPEWTSGLVGSPEGMAQGRLMPAEAGKPGVAVWRFRTPYIVSDAEVRLRLVRKSRQDAVRLHLSVDDGRTWKPLWECPADVVGEKDLVVPICEKFLVVSKAKAPEGFNSPFGRYHYRLKLELLARDVPQDCRVQAIEFRTTVQQNYYSLPQLQPGRNHITVKGHLAEGAALKVTYVWDDPAGKDRRNATVVERTPYTYEIVAAGRKWEDCVCKSITIEAVSATGEGNRTEVKEAPGEFTELPPPRPAAETRECMLIRPDRATLPPVEQLIKDLETPEKTRAALYGLIQLRDPRAFDPIKRIVYEVQPPAEWKDPLTGVKEISLAAIYAVDRERAKPVLLDILADAKRSKWKEDDKGLPGHWITGAAIIGYIAADAGWKDFVPPLVSALEGPQGKGEFARALLRSLGRLGDARAAKAIRRSLDDKDADTVQVAALAAGQVGDRMAIPRLRELLSHGYSPVSCSAALALGMLGDKPSAPAIRPWLGRTRDENYRGVAAEALGAMGDRESLQALEAALKVEPFPWVREKITAALSRMKP